MRGEVKGGEERCVMGMRGVEERRGMERCGLGDGERRGENRGEQREGEVCYGDEGS